MFDHISLTRIRFKKTTTEFDFTLPDFQSASSKMEMEDDNLLTQNASFCLDGEAASCKNRELSDFARDNSLYILGFSLWEAGEFFFTRRFSLDAYLLILTYEGEGLLEYEGRQHILQTGDCFLIDCRKPHMYKTSGLFWNCGFLVFRGKREEQLYTYYLEQGIVHFNMREYPEFQPLLEQALEAHEGNLPIREFLVSNRLEALLLLPLYAESENRSGSEAVPDTIQYLKRYLESNYRQKLTLDDLSAFSGLSKYHLSKLFKRYVGVSPIEYIIQLRINAAQGLLENTNLPANKIAAAVGIMNENYFYRLFREYTGVTPSEYREWR